jgi:ankyrin repeat protein/truncated hemoglobin YjbI
MTPPPRARAAGGKRQADVQTLLRHRGRLPAARPPSGLFAALGGKRGIGRLVDELYERIGADPLLRHVFPNPEATRDGPRRFFVEWFGGEREFSGGLGSGLAQRHQSLFVSPKGADAWLRCLREALAACGQSPAPVLRLLAPLARALVNSVDVDPAELRPHCGGTPHPGAERLEAVLGDVARGRTDRVRRAVAADPPLVHARGRDGQSLLWLAAYRNRPRIVEFLLDAGADPNACARDPLRGAVAGKRVHPGTIVSVSPLALARKHERQFLPLLIARGARDDVFTAAWTGDRDGVVEFIDRHPLLVNAPDPAEDFQEVTPLAHALAGGDLGVASLLIERGAEVRTHSAKLLGIAIALERPDLVRLLLAHGADARRSDSLGPLDAEERPIAQLLLAHGATVPRSLLPRACRADVSHNELHRVRVLLDYGADINGRGREGLTALHYAVRSGKLPLIRLLLDRGADVAVRDPEGLTPLLQLTRTRARMDHVAVLELLAGHGADLDARNRHGETLLFFYARRGDGRAVRWLLAHGADPTVRNRRGHSAVALPVQRLRFRVPWKG